MFVSGWRLARVASGVERFGVEMGAKGARKGDHRDPADRGGQRAV